MSPAKHAGGEAREGRKPAQSSKSEREKSGGANARPLDDTIAQTGAGIPDDSGHQVEPDAGIEQGVRQVMSKPHHDTTVKKVSGSASPKGRMGQTELVSGKKVSMRLWENEEPHSKQATSRDYETVGYVISGRAELEVEGQTLHLEPGDSWLVPAGSSHKYKILEPFTAVEATAPPAQVHGRDE